MTWNPPPEFTASSVPTLDEWNRFITSLDAMQTRFLPDTPAFRTRHNAYLQFASNGTLQTSHTVPLPASATVGSLVGLWAVVSDTSNSVYGGTWFFYHNGTNQNQNATAGFGTITASLSASGTLTLSCTVAIRYAGYAVLLLP